MNDTPPADASIGPRQLRRLGADEIVRPGDYVAARDGAFEFWEGPGGFQADSFLKAIYRPVAPDAPAVTAKP